MHLTEHRKKTCKTHLEKVDATEIKQITGETNVRRNAEHATSSTATTRATRSAQQSATADGCGTAH
jgi:hypothetical protein